MTDDRPAAPATGKFDDLKTRLVSAAVIALAALGLVWAGGWWIAVLASAAAGQMMLEWVRITARGGTAAPAVIVMIAAVLIGPLVAEGAGVTVGLGCLFAGGVAGLFLDLAGRARRTSPGSAHALWDVVGLAYLGTAAIALVALRQFEPWGLLSIVWAALVVVAADVGGYFAGKLIGGPRLWPAVSPKKTWAGLAGGVALAVLVGGIFSWATTGTWFQQVCTVSAIAAVLSQLGDLGESALKRHFGVKDAGALIPGHGGVLDRLDGHIAAILVAAAVTFSRGQAVFVW